MRTGMATVTDLCTEFGVHRSTIYSKTFAWLWSRVVYVGDASPRFHWSDVELFKANHQRGGRRRRATA